jgi:hypothetical protein
MDELKQGYTAVLTMGILGAAGLVPRGLQKQALDFLAKKATAVMTNVPGPQEPLYMGGAEIKRIMVWVPQSGNIGVGVSILSYAGGVQFGLITDKRLCEEPQRIIDRFEPEFEKLVLALCMLPWDGSVNGDEAESWLFPSIESPPRIKNPKRRSRTARRSSADRPAASAASPPEVAADTATPESPAGQAARATSSTNAAPRMRRRRSAFAAARDDSRG